MPYLPFTLTQIVISDKADLKITCFTFLLPHTKGNTQNKGIVSDATTKHFIKYVEGIKKLGILNAEHRNLSPEKGQRESSSQMISGNS